MILAGVDEAGRGPCIGPVVICAASIEENKQAELKKLGVADSKELSPAKREKLFSELLSFPGLQYKLVQVSAAEVDAAVESTSTNLNWLEADHTAELVRYLNPAKVIVDCPSPNLAAYRNYLKKKIGLDLEVVTEHKADQNHPIVSAASILAKVTRDAAISELKKKIGHDFGSGYPSDPKTSAFLKKHWKTYPDIFRKSWSTYRKVAQTV